ncbi:MAG: adenylate kinase [Candidatus Tectomicrobia bacterium]|uniref:Adenylate kinase n=1 Tax=Tectimicrobiota bacterium TaxID=2528274 RepID=A0A937W203_UNCTE|nr:adenylate kinase [Candidatus Tectomicrobia bacterium]
MDNPDSLGTRISIRGATGSGKTTLGHLLGQRLGLPVVELDALYWLPNWQSNPLEQFRVDVQAALDACPQGWICVGNYRNVADLVLSQANTVLWLRLPFRVAFWRLLKRTIRRAWTQQLLWEGNPNRESWRESFFSRESILLYALTTSRRTHVATTLRLLGTTPHQATVIELRSAKAVRQLLQGLSP